MGDQTEVEMQWWWSRDEERFHGPCHSRADAIMEAWADDEDQGAYICQASQGPWRSELFDVDRLAEMFDAANEEGSDPDGDPPSEALSTDQWQAICKRLNNVVRLAIRNIGVMSWGFTEQTGCDYVAIPAAFAMATALRSASKLAEERGE